MGVDVVDVRKLGSSAKEKRLALFAFGANIDTMKIEDLVAAMRAAPQNVRFSEAVKVARHYFGEPRQQGSSHSVWKMPWPGDPRVNLQNRNGMAKAYQVRQLLDAVSLLTQKRK